MIKKILLCISIVIIFSLTVYAINDTQDKNPWDSKITDSDIDISINNERYTITIDGVVCVENIPFKINTTTYQISNITELKNVNAINAFTFSAHNSTHQIYKDKDIYINLALYGSGHIMNKE